MSLALSRSECESFVAGTHVGVFCVAEEGRGPIATPVWYAYEPGGDVVLVTGETTRKVPHLRKTGRATLCVQDERPPFRYVTIEGPVRIEKTATEPIVRAEALRYVGRARAEVYLRKSAGERAGEVVIRLTPKRWFSADYGEFFPPV
jgi:PPOX class probable F420-dependent enzyme